MTLFGSIAAGENHFFIQMDEPTDHINGTLWFNTDTNELSIFIE